jgi:hypothetical protein
LILILRPLGIYTERPLNRWGAAHAQDAQGGFRGGARVTANIEAASCGALAQIKEDLARLELQPDLSDSVSQHYEHLEALSATLKTLGIDDRTIDQHVVDIFNTYKIELLRNIERLRNA